MKFFDLDSPLSKLLTNIADLMLVNLLFIAFSIPVVTIGASLTAMNYVTLQILDNKQPDIFDTFLKAFKENLKQSTILWGIFVGLGIVLFAWYIVIENMVIIGLASVLRIFLYIFIAIYSFILTYVFYLQAKFENTVKELIKNAFLMSIRHLPTTLFSLAILGGSLILVMFYPKLIGYGLIVLLCGFSINSYAIGFFMKRVFRKYA